MSTNDAESLNNTGSNLLSPKNFLRVHYSFFNYVFMQPVMHFLSIEQWTKTSPYIFKVLNISFPFISFCYILNWIKKKPESRWNCFWVGRDEIESYPKFMCLQKPWKHLFALLPYFGVQFNITISSSFKFLYLNSFFPMHITCPTLHVLLSLIILSKLSETEQIMWILFE